MEVEKKYVDLFTFFMIWIKVDSSCECFPMISKVKFKLYSLNIFVAL